MNDIMQPTGVHSEDHTEAIMTYTCKPSCIPSMSHHEAYLEAVLAHLEAILAYIWKPAADVRVILKSVRNVHLDAILKPIWTTS